MSIAVPTAPAVLLPYQQKWVADNSPVKIFVKSRRIGGSWAEAGESALEASKKNGQDTWYIGYAKDMAVEFIRDVADWANAYNLVASEISEYEEVFTDGDEKKAILAFTIKFASGYRVTALSSAPRNLRGKQGRVVIDEAAFHDNLGELLKAAFALLIWGGCVRIISTHNGVSNPFNQLVEDVKAGKLPYSLHTCTFDEALKQGLYKRICLKKGITWTAESEKIWADEIRKIYADNVDEELNCIPKNSGGKWLSRALIESRMSDDVPLLLYKRDDDFNLKSEAYRSADCEAWCMDNIQPILDRLPAGAKCFVGGDYGRNGDLSDFDLVIRTSGLVVECVATFELENIPFAQQEQVLNYLCDGIKLQGAMLLGMALDARGIGVSNSEKAQQRYGTSVVECVMLTNAWYALNMPPFKSALEDGMLDKLQRHENVLSDLLAFEVIDGVPKLPKQKNEGKNKQKRHGDIGIAKVLMYYASRTLNDGAVTVASRPVDTDTDVQRGIGLMQRFKNMIRGYD